MSQRLDRALVSQGLFASRAKAQEAIAAGVVAVNGEVATKPSLTVGESDELSVIGATLRYVSRAGLKLERAIEAFGLDLSGRTILDIGASTGGFTDCALQHGAQLSYAVDVGSDQLARSLRNDPRVVCMEGTDIRTLDPACVADATFAVIDVSFISVTKIVDVFDRLPGIAEVVCLVKPQFECGREVARRFKGIPLDEGVHHEAIATVIGAFSGHGFACTGLVPSPVRGQSGNIEYLARLERTASDVAVDIDGCVRDAFGAEDAYRA